MNVRIDESDVMRRIKDTCSFRNVGLSGDISDLEAKKALAEHSAYVILGAELIDQLPDTNDCEFLVTLNFGVALVARSYRLNVADAVEHLKPMRESLRESMRAWRPDQCDRIELEGGEMMRTGAELSVWFERFSVSYQISV